MEKGKIGVRQFTILVIMFTLGTALLNLPTVFASTSKQDSWLSGLLGLGVGLLVCLLYLEIATRFPDKNLFEINEHLLGKWVGRAVSLLYVVYFFLISVILLRDVGDFLATEILFSTPILFTQAMLLIVVLIAVRMGLESIAHTAELFFPWVLGMLTLLLVLVSPQIRFEYLLPVLGSGIKPVVQGVYEFLIFPFVELVVFLVIYPNIRPVNGTQRSIRNAFLVGTLISGGLLLLLSIVTILVLDVDVTSRNMYASYALANKISIGHFLERVEALMATVWLVTIFFKVTINFYAATLGLAHTLRLREYRPLVLPLGLILLALSISIFPNIVYFLTTFGKAWAPNVLLFGLVLPLVLLVVGTVRKRGQSGVSGKALDG